MANRIVRYTCVCGHVSGESLQDETYEPNVFCPKCAERMARVVNSEWGRGYDAGQGGLTLAIETAKTLEQHRIVRELRNILANRQAVANGGPVSLTLSFDEVLAVVQREQAQSAA